MRSVRYSIVIIGSFSALQRKRVGVAHATIWNFQREELKIFPYKLQMTNALTERHTERRLKFSRDCSRKLRNNAGYLKRIVFSDECKFSLSGSVNNQNSRIWGSERPNKVYETLRNSPSIMVWCAPSESEITWLYFFENRNVTGSTYKRMLRYFFVSQARKVLRRHDFQQGGAPPYYSLEARQYLDRNMLGRWMGRGGPIDWPARSPDLTPCDYFIWVTSKIQFTETDLELFLSLS